jgi:hypothetical protein
MSKTAKEIGMILGGVALAAIPGLQWAAPGLICAAGAHAALLSAMFGVGLSTALSGIGLAVRPALPSVGSANSIGFNSGISPRRVIYGQFQTAGVLTYASFPPSQNQATTSQYLHLVFTIAAHEISSFDGVIVDGFMYNFGSDILQDSSLPFTPWQVHPDANISVNDFYWEHLMFEFDCGKPANGAQPFPNLADADSSWTGDCLQRGCAKVHVILRADSGWTALYPSGQIPNIQFLVTGKKLIDPRITTDWIASTSFPKYSYVIDGNGLIWFQQNVGGVSAASRPNFEAHSGSTGFTLADNTCTWFNTGWALTGLYNGNTAPPYLAPGPASGAAILLNDSWSGPGAVLAGPVGTTVIEAPIGYFQVLTTTGTTGTDHPRFSTTRGGTTADGSCVWTCLGRSTHAINPSNPALIVNDYLQDSDYGLGIPGPGSKTYTTQAITGGVTTICATTNINGLAVGMSILVDGGTANAEVVVLTNLGSPGSPEIFGSFQNNHLAGATVLGLGAPQSIDVSSVIAAANTCETQTLIIWNADNSTVHENLYSCNGMFDHSSTRGNVLAALCASMAGWVIPPGDQWHVFAGAYVSPTITLTDADFRGPIKGDFRLSKREIANSIKGTFTPAYLPASPAAAISLNSVPGIWQSQSFPPYQANGLAHKPNYLNSEDAGQVIWQDVHFEFTTSVWTAQRLAKIALMRLRFQQTLTLQCKLTAFDLEAGDTFGLIHLRWGISSAYEATQVSVVFDNDKDGMPIIGIDIIARQTDPSIYSFTAPTSSSDFGEYSPYGVTGVMTGVE